MVDLMIDQSMVYGSGNRIAIKYQELEYQIDLYLDSYCCHRQFDCMASYLCMGCNQNNELVKNKFEMDNRKKINQ